MTQKRVIVTGGAGFLGSHLVDRLVETTDYEIIVIDNFSSGKQENLAQHIGNGSVDIVTADIRDKKRMQKLIKKAEVVYHLAVACLRISINNPEFVHEVNSTGTLNLLQSSFENGVKKFVYISSSESYGTAKYIPMDESHPCEPTTIYGSSKLTGEIYTRAYYKTYGLPVVIIRPFNFYGPREHFEGPYGEVIPRFVIRVLNGIPPMIFGDGEQTRDFTYVSDTVEGVLYASNCNDLIGDVVNVASGREVSIKRVAEIVLDKLGKRNLRPIHIDSRPGDVRQHLADISKAKKILGFKPCIDIEEGISRYIGWLVNQNIDFKKLLKEVEEINW